jgi:ABC-type lipopolysaccharide export system ATPase subunit
MKIITLCGSTKFYKEFDNQNRRLTLEGNIVLSIGCVTASDKKLQLSKEIKQMLDDLHLRKIDLSDEIFVIDICGYIGESTRNEINYAISKRKKVKYFSTYEFD